MGIIEGWYFGSSSGEEKSVFEAPNASVTRIGAF